MSTTDTSQRTRHHVLREGAGPHRSPPAASPTPTASWDRRAGSPSSSSSTSPRPWTTGTRASSTRSPRTTTSSPSTTAASAPPPAACPTASRRWPTTPYTFIKALGFDKVDIFSFSLGGMVAQALVVKHPELVRKLILTGTGPAGGKDIDKVAGTTYYDILRATLTRSGPEGVPVLQPQRHRQARRARRSSKRLKERTADRDTPIKVKAFQTQLKAIKQVGPLGPGRPVEDHPAHPDRQRRQRPDGPLRALRRPPPPHQRLRADHLPRLRPRRHLPVPRQVRPRRASSSSPADRHRPHETQNGAPP